MFRVCLLLVLLTSTAYAGTQFKYMTGGRHRLGDTHYDTLRLDQTNQWKYGDSLLFLEVRNPFAQGTNLYSEWSPRLSLSKAFDRDMEFSFVKDSFIATQINVSGSGFRAYLYGVGFSFDIPGFKFSGVNIYNRDNPDLPGSTYQITPYWNLPFSIKDVHFIFFGHADIAGRQGPTYRVNQLVQPYLTVDVGDFWGHPKSILSGVRWTYWHHSGGGTGTENVLEFVLAWNFA